MIKKIGLLISITLASGCASTYEHSKLRSPDQKLDSSKAVLISVPEDGWYENTQYRNSGRMTANAVRAAFAKRANKVDLINDCIDEKCLESIDNESYGYYVNPIILHWEERATEWSGKPDRIEIQIVVYDVSTKKQIANSSYKGISKWLTFGGDHPQDLLPEPTNKYVKNLYQ